MPDRYSTYEAKAKLSEILRRVRAGSTIEITYRGEPVAEIRPLRKAVTLADRLRQLEERGVIVPPREPRGELEPLARRPGALQRFLDDRNQ